MNVVAMVVGVPFRGASSVPLSLSAAPVARSLAASMDDDSPGTGEPKDPANQTETVTMLGPERQPPSLFLSHSLLEHTYPSLGMDAHIRLKP